MELLTSHKWIFRVALARETEVLRGRLGYSGGRRRVKYSATAWAVHESTTSIHAMSLMYVAQAKPVIDSAMSVTEPLRCESFWRVR